MREARILLVSGIWVAVLPYLGFPRSLKDVLSTASGLGLIFLSYILYRDFKKRGKTEEKTFDNFSENANFEESGHDKPIKN